MTSISKNCKTCGLLLPVTSKFFHKNSGMKDGFISKCKSCANAEDRQFAANNPEAIAARRKRAYEKQKSKWLQRQREYRLANPEIIRQRKKSYAERNREKELQRKREWNKRPEVQLRRKMILRSNPDLRARRRESSRRTQAKRDKAAYNKYHTQWLDAVPGRRISHSMATAMNRCLVKGKGGRSWRSLVGYSLDELVAHLESQFADGMSWGNYGARGWHVDHKIPVAAFVFSSAQDEQFKICWSLKNLRPLWETDNCSKRADILPEFADDFFGATN